jgi:CheY-like chemotaxis protein
MGTPPKIEVTPLRLKRALFIDADPEIREMLRDILDPRRWSVRHAANNLAAFELVKQTAFDLIITSDKTSGREK